MEWNGYPQCIINTYIHIHDCFYWYRKYNMNVCNAFKYVCYIEFCKKVEDCMSKSCKYHIAKKEISMNFNCIHIYLIF